MKTYDYNQVASILLPLKAKFDDCAHGEGNQCETLNTHLECCAEICREFAGALRDWAQAVFSGEVVFDAQAENLWRTEIQQIHARAVRTWLIARKEEIPCYELPGQNNLAAALWELQWVLEDWVSPKLAVGPSARIKPQLSQEQREKIRQQLASLPPLQANKNQ